MTSIGIRRETAVVNGPVGEDVGEEVDMEDERLLFLQRRVERLELWKEEEHDPWRAGVDGRLEEIDLTEQETNHRLDKVMGQIKKLESNNGCIYFRDVLILSSIILTIIFIIIVLF